MQKAREKEKGKTAPLHDATKLPATPTPRQADGAALPEGASKETLNKNKTRRAAATTKVEAQAATEV